MTISGLLTTALALAATVPLAAQQPPPPGKTTAVLVILTAKANVNREQIAKILPDEVRATVRLYLDGKIRDWYSRADGRGVVFVMDTKDPAEAEALLNALPLGKEGLMDHQVVPLAPLAPLGLLAGKQ